MSKGNIYLHNITPVTPQSLSADFDFHSTRTAEDLLCTQVIRLYCSIHSTARALNSKFTMHLSRTLLLSALLSLSGAVPTIEQRATAAGEKYPCCFLSELRTGVTQIDFAKHVEHICFNVLGSPGQAHVERYPESYDKDRRHAICWGLSWGSTAGQNRKTGTIDTTQFECMKYYYPYKGENLAGQCQDTKRS